MNNKINISIIIPVYNQFDYTLNCIRYIEKNTEQEEGYLYEIIIVDNNSTDETGHLIEELSKQRDYIRYIKLDRNYGFGYACNFGARNAEGDYLVFLNNDTEPQNNWLKQGINRLINDESIGIVGAKLLYPDYTIQHCGIEFFENVNPNYTFWPLHRYLNVDKDDERVNKAEEVAGVTGACLFISKRIFDSVNGFDENYWMYFEDLDLCFKVRKLGYKIFYEPTSLVIHYEGKSSSNQNAIDELNSKSAKYFFNKWERDVKYYLLSKYFEYHDNRYTILKKDIYPKSLLDGNYERDIGLSTKEYITFIELIDSIGEAYVHFGGAGDALLLLSTFYDKNPEQVIISFANSVKALKSFFNAFPALKHVYFLPLPSNYVLHTSLRKILPKLKNIKGMGITPTDSYDKEWNESLDIFRKYKVIKRPAWIGNFKKSKLLPFQITIAPKGSLFGMVGSKRNVISYNDWKKTLKYFNKRGIKLIILGTPEEKNDYPDINEENIDKRSYSFQEQMEFIAGSDIFIGADSWGKTFAALAGIKTFVYKPLRGKDLEHWKDSSEYVFINPWENISLVQNFNELKKYLDQIPLLNRELKIAIDGPIKSMNSLSKVNAELALQFINKGYNIDFISDDDIDNSFINDGHYRILKKYLRRNKTYDIVISHYFPPKINRPPTDKWIVIQPWEFGSIPEKWLDIFQKLVDEIWVPSTFVANIFVQDGIDRAKIKVISNGVNSSIYKKSDKKFPLKTRRKIKFLYVGGTIYRKGIDILLKAYLSAFNEKDDVCLVIKDVGANAVYRDSNYSEQIKKIMELQNTPEIEYINRNLSEDELSALYNSCDFLLHPYRAEGFAMPVLEAMACGLIPIVTENGATEDFCNEQNSIKIHSTRIYLNENKIGEYKTVSKPWILEPDLNDLVRVLKNVYNNAPQFKEKFSNSLVHIGKFWDWESTFYKVQDRINYLINDSTQVTKSEDKQKFQNAKIDNLNRLFSEISEKIRNNEVNACIDLIVPFIQNNFDELETEEKILLCNIAGNIYLADKNLVLAQQYFEKELNLNPQSSSACFGLGQVFLMQDNLEAAKIMFEWAVKNDPNNTSAIDALANVNNLLGYELNHSSLEVS